MANGNHSTPARAAKIMAVALTDPAVAATSAKRAG
jgi:hypothetical protein